MTKIILAFVLFVALASQALCYVRPVAHCWENDVGGNGGVILYFGAISTEPAPVEVPSGSNNYMSGALAPPVYFWPDLNGFQKGVVVIPPASIHWVLSGYSVSLSSSNNAQVCNATLPQLLTLQFNLPEGIFASLNQSEVTDAIRPILAENSAFDPEMITGWTYLPTPTGFTIGVTFQPSTHPSQYRAIQTLISLSADRLHNEFNDALAQAVSPNATVARLFGYGTSTDVEGTPLPPPPPFSLAPVALSPPAMALNPIIPFADCYQRNNSGINYYFGYNNTNANTVHIDSDASNFALVGSGRTVRTITTFNPGFTALAHSVFIPLGPLEKGPVITWYLLNYYVSLQPYGVLQECSSTVSLIVRIGFNGKSIDAGVQLQLYNVIATAAGVNSEYLSLNVAGRSPSWNLEITISREAGVYAAANRLFRAFYEDLTFASQLDAITGAEAEILQVYPTSTERPGTHRPIPVTPIAPKNPPHKGMSGGKIFGIIFGVFVAIGLLAAIAYHLKQKNSGKEGFERLIN